MDHIHPKRKLINPEIKSNFISNLFFCYTRQIFVKSLKKNLTEDDIYEVNSSHKAKYLGDKLENEWKKQVLQGKTSVLSLLWTCFGRHYLIILSTIIIPLAQMILQPKILKTLLFYFTKEGSKHNRTEAWLYGFFLLLVLFIGHLHLMNFQLRLKTFAFKVRAALISLIYKTALKMNSSQLSTVSVGKIITLITKDVTDFEDGIFWVTSMTRDIAKIVIYCCVLYTEIGWLFLIFVAVILVAIFATSCLAYVVKILKLKTLKRSDERYQATKELIGGIKLLKMNLWTESFCKKILEIRKKEVDTTSKIYVLFCTKFIVTETIMNATWYILIVASIYSGLQLSAGTLFLIINGLNIISSHLTITLSGGLHEIARMYIICTRIGDYLRSVDTKPSINSNVEEDELPKVLLSNLKVTGSNQTILNSINFKICSNGINAITGNTGSGKSLLFKVLTGEHRDYEGVVNLVGTVSYASQEPWMFPSTIKQNILFGSRYNSTRYMEVLRVCALLDDLKLLEKGDETIVVHNGRNLSGGQKVRINLARALYKNRDVYLLDEPLSSLDVLVADFIFEECFQKFLKDKIVILTTRNEKHISNSNQVLILNEDLTRSRLESVPEKYVGDMGFPDTISSVEKFHEDGFDETTRLITTDVGMYMEIPVAGRVKFKAYKKYFQSGGKIIVFVVVLVLAGIVQFTNATLRKLESQWINTEQSIYDNSTNEQAIQNRHQMLYTFPVLLLIALCVTILTIKLFWFFAKKVSLNLHQTLLCNVVKAKMTFLDSRPLGSILNRFSQDLRCVDEMAPLMLYLAIKNMVSTIALIILILTVNPVFFIPCLAFMIMMMVTGIFYLKVGNFVKRYELSSRSPVVGYLTATLEGLLTIKVSKTEDILREEFDRHLDDFTSSSYMYECCEKTFRFLGGVYGVILIAAIEIFFLLAGKDISVGNVGLVLSQTMIFALFFQMLFSTLVDIENQITAVERIMEFTEAKQEEGGTVVVNNWPSECKIVFSNVFLSYKDNDNYTLQNLNFTVESKEKLAIIGRTASGKTSIVSAILRLYDIKGDIFIDGVNIAHLALNFLRSKISVVPQDPILFSGTIRENIDPTMTISDDKIWEAIKLVGLTSMFKSLEDKVSSTDSGLSAGQKQLLCLCRALVSNNKIVILDEVTANVDQQTEEMIHEVIKKGFEDCTVITITHKLSQINYYDKVMVLEKGKVVQFGSPFSLMQNQNGNMYKLCKNSVRQT